MPMSPDPLQAGKPGSPYYAYSNSKRPLDDSLRGEKREKYNNFNLKIYIDLDHFYYPTNKLLSVFSLFALFSDEPEVFLPKYSQMAILHAAHFRRVVKHNLPTLPKEIP